MLPLPLDAADPNLSRFLRHGLLRETQQRLFALQGTQDSRKSLFQAGGGLSSWFATLDAPLSTGSMVSSERHPTASGNRLKSILAAGKRNIWG